MIKKTKKTPLVKRLLKEQEESLRRKTVIVYIEDGEEKRYELNEKEYYEAAMGYIPKEITDKLDAGKQISIARIENLKMKR